jgi:hypothetical protein
MARILSHDEKCDQERPELALTVNEHPSYPGDPGLGLVFYAERHILQIGMVWDGAERCVVELSRGDVIRLYEIVV